MGQQKNPEDKDHIAVRLDSDRRKEIDDIRTRFESFYRDEIKFQTEIKNSINLVSQKQDSLKERFESGTAATLRDLRKDFSTFLMEWGKKQEQDKTRDIRISTVDKKSEDNRNNINWLVRSLIISVCSGVLLAGIMYAFQIFKG